MENNEIKITHFVNPHFFYFRWVRDEGFNEELKKLEDKIENISKEDTSSVKSDESPDTRMRIGDVVGVFVPDWNKWIRASIKKKDDTERYSVWAIDYGYPLVARASHVIKLPRSFQGMQFANKKILIGGIENIVPAELRFDDMLENSRKEKLANWSPAAIQLAQDILQKAIKLEFENVHEYVQVKSSHIFGRLMIQRSDGQMVNVVKCLLDMNVAALAELEFQAEIKTSETLRQPHWLSVKGEMLTINFVVTPVVVTKNQTGYTDKEFFDEEHVVVDDEIALPDASDETFFDESVSMIRPMNSLQYNYDTESKNGSNDQAPIAIENVLPSTNDNNETKSKCSIEQQNGNSTPKAPNDVNQRQQNEIQRSGRRFEARNNLDGRRDPHRFNNQPNNQRPQQFQHQRAMVPNHHSPHPNQFNRPPIRPPNQFNLYPNQFNVPMPFHQPPIAQFNQQSGRRNTGGYALPNMRPNNQNRRNRHDPPHKQFGDPEFVASFGRPQLAKINEHVPMLNSPKNVPQYHTPVQPFARPGFDPNNENTQPNERSKTRRRKYNRGKGSEKNDNKKSTENGKAKSDGASTSTEQTTPTKIERLTQQMEIKNGPVLNEADSKVEATSNASTENVVVKTEPKQEKTDE